MIKRDKGEDGPVGRNFRAVHVWDCTPAFTGRKKGGIAVAALALVTDEAQILPYRLDLNTVTELVEKLVGVLQHFGHPGSKELLERLTHEWPWAGDPPPVPAATKKKNPSWGKVSHDDGTEVDDPQSAFEYHEKTYSGGIPVTGVIMKVQWEKAPKPAEHETYGGYYSGDRYMVMHRFFGNGNGKPHYFDSVCRVGRDGTYVVECGVTDSRLRLQDWQRFSELPAGAEFRIEGTIWRKLTVPQLRRLLRKVLIPKSY